ncbi:MAG: hypothetical protein KDK91_27895 [Gammaproteobacteria bacterium]|nr:hypothetical protein [Gammaproteobacteria bacterium]
MRQQYRLTLIIQGPLLSAAAGGLVHGVDAMMVREPSTLLGVPGAPALPGSLVRGNLRHTLSYFARALADAGTSESARARDQLSSHIDRWFGREGNPEPTPWDGPASASSPPRPHSDLATARQPAGPVGSRASLGFDHLWRLTQATNLPASTRTRIRIEADTGLAAPGMLQVVEDCFAVDTPYHFEGLVRCRFTSGDPDRERADFERWLPKALNYMSAIGALKGIGHGRLSDHRLTREAVATPSPPIRPPHIDCRRLGITLHLDRAFFLGRSKTADSNQLESVTEITGATIKAVLAEGPLGKRLKQQRDCFDGLLVTHAVASLRHQPMRHPPWPLSLCRFDDQLRDVGLHRAPCLLMRLANQEPHPAADRGVIGIADVDSSPGWLSTPSFALDWKEKDQQAVAAELQRRFSWGRPSPRRTLTLHTAITDERNIAAEGQLFSLLCVEPDTLCWLADIDLSHIECDTQRTHFYELLCEAFASGLDDIGKTRAHADVSLVHGGHNAPATCFRSHQGLHLITLFSEARLIDEQALAGMIPDGIDAAGSDRITALYRRYFARISNGTLRLSHCYTRERLAGGLAYHLRFRAPAGEPNYAPTWLTQAGSVFALAPVDGHSPPEVERHLRLWSRRGLPVAADRETDDWRSDPYRPENGYGEIRINHPPQRLLTEAGPGFRYVAC